MLHQFLIKKNICKIEKINLFLLFWGIKWCMFKKSGNKNVLKSWSNQGNDLFLKKCVNIRHLVFWMVTVKLSQSQQHQQHPRHTGEKQRHLHADAADARAREPGKCGAECASGPPSVFFACFNFFPTMLLLLLLCGRRRPTRVLVRRKSAVACAMRLWSPGCPPAAPTRSNPAPSCRCARPPACWSARAPCSSSSRESLKNKIKKLL